MNFHKVTVLGAGQMGRGIAQLCASCGLDVDLQDNHAEQVAAALPTITATLQRAVERGTGSAEESEATVNRITVREGTDNIGEWIGDADIIVEAISEDFAAKVELYGTVEPHLNDKAIFATNTSSFSIGELAAKLKRQERFIGVHFMNPAPRMKLVEIIPSAATDDKTVADSHAFAQMLGKETVQSADRAGFLTNRILMPLINEAVWALHDKTGSAEDIDRAMTLGMNHPMGPLTLADFIGLDTCLAVLHTLYNGFGDDKFLPCPLLAKMVEEGKLGRKTKVGFYDYRK